MMTYLPTEAQAACISYNGSHRCDSSANVSVQDEDVDLR